MTRPQWMRILLLVTALSSGGCLPPGERLTFPYRRLVATRAPQWFDVDHDGGNDFRITFDASGRLDTLGYDDDGDGAPDRLYRPRDEADDRVPHLLIVLDSVPYRTLVKRYEAGEFRWFAPPAKVIAPFPSLTEVCCNALLHGPPTPGVMDQYYDRRAGRKRNGIWKRAVEGKKYSWERELHYRSTFFEEGLSYLNPRPWYHGELARARQALDHSPDRVTIVYLASSSAMACRYGEAGINEVLDGAAQLCLQLLYERRGALKISVMADHGHNLAPSSTNIDIEKLLRDGGFRIATRLGRPRDVVPELNGLVTYGGVRTIRPRAVADRLLTHEGVEFAMYLEGDRLIVRDREGAATIECRGERLRYHPAERDVFGYGELLEKLPADDDGFVARDDLFAATVDHTYPDAVANVWDAFHSRAIDPPEVMFTTRAGWCAGLKSYEKYITMRSTHGSLDQANVATFVMTMTRRPTTRPMRTREVLPAVEPSWRPGVRR